MSIKIRVIAIVSLVFAVTSARAGIIIVPGSLQYNPVPIPTQDVTVPMLVIRSTGLDGVIEPDCSEVAVVHDCAGVPFSQQLEIAVNLDTGKVSGRTRGQLGISGSFDFVARVRGEATCLPFDGRPCGQLIVDLEVQGSFYKPTNPASVGQIQMQVLGSLIRDSVSVQWSALTANTTLGFALSDDVAELLSAEFWF